MWKEIGRFAAQDDAGNVYTIVESQKVVQARMLSGQINRAMGSKELRLISGEGVNYVDDETFQIVGSRATIRRI